MRNAGEIDLGEIDAAGPQRESARPGPRRHWLALLVAVTLALAALLWPTSESDPAPPEPSPPPSDRAPTGIAVFPGNGFDDVLVLGLPFGLDDAGLLARVDLATGDVTIEDATSVVVPVEPATSVTSPDGRHLAVFTRHGRTRSTGVSVFPDGGPTRQFHRLQSVAALIGPGLVWSSDSDTVYVLAGDAPGGTADRVVAVRVDGSARTVVRVDGRGWRTLAVSPPPST